jgi:hypothetical protein
MVKRFLLSVGAFMISAMNQGQNHWKHQLQTGDHSLVRQRLDRRPGSFWIFRRTVLVLGNPLIRFKEFNPRQALPVLDFCLG